MSQQQRSEEWYKLRLGKFTASEIHKLLSTGSRKMTEEELESYKKENPKGKRTTIDCLGDTFETYCFEKAVEIVFGIDEEESFTSFDMKRGIELEPIAFRKFQELKDLDFVEVKEAYFFPFGEDAGASPDGVVGNDGVLEIKCPRSGKFFKLIKGGLDEIDKEYIAQMQFQMLCSNSKNAHFFNYIIFKGKEMWHEIVVERDEKMIDLIKERLVQAIKLRNEFVEYLINHKQF